MTHIRIFHKNRKLDKKGGGYCKLCKCVLRKKEMTDHMRLEHDKPGECPLCDFGPGTVNITAMVYASYIPCNASQRDEELLRRHIKAKHRTPIVGHRCSYCYKPFETVQLKSQHRKQCKARARVGLCTVCGKEAPLRGMKQHACQLTKQYPCKVCSKVYMRPDALKKHLLRSHFPDKKEHVCSQCGRAFVMKFELDKHILMHGQPTIKCTWEFCDKTFKWRYGVVQHLIGLWIFLRILLNKSQPP